MPSLAVVQAELLVTLHWLLWVAVVYHTTSFCKLKRNAIGLGSTAVTGWANSSFLS